MSRLQTLILDQGRADVHRWLPPDVGLPPQAAPAEPVVPMPSEAEVAAIRQAAHAAGAKAGYEAGYLEGYQKGHQEGRDAADQEAADEQRARAEREEEQREHQAQTLRETVAALEGMARELADPLASLVDALEPELLTLTVTLARRVVMEELATRPTLIQGVLQRALAQLPSRHHALRVRVHPDDQTILETYAESHGESITWLADTAVERGGCILESGPSRIDARVEARLRQSIDAIWGELTRPPLVADPVEPTEVMDAGETIESAVEADLTEAAAEETS